MTVTVKKFRDATRSWGSPGENYKVAAAYVVLVDGHEVATIRTMNHEIHYMDSVMWLVEAINNSWTGYARTFREAKEKAIAHYSKREV